MRQYRYPVGPLSLPAWLFLVEGVEGRRMLPDGPDHYDAVQECRRFGMIAPTRFALEVTERGRTYYGSTIAGTIRSRVVGERRRPNPEAEREEFKRDIDTWEKLHPIRDWSTRAPGHRIDIDDMPEKADIL